MKLRILITLFVAILSFSSYADQRGPDNQDPTSTLDKFIAACNGKAKGDDCWYMGRKSVRFISSCDHGANGNGELACQAVPAKKTVDACNGKAKGASCTFAGSSGKTVSGTCYKVPRPHVMTCRSSHPPEI